MAVLSVTIPDQYVPRVVEACIIQYLPAEERDDMRNATPAEQAVFVKECVKNFLRGITLRVEHSEYNNAYVPEELTIDD